MYAALQRQAIPMRPAPYAVSTAAGARPWIGRTADRRPANPRVLAAVWQRRRLPWLLQQGGMT